MNNLLEKLFEHNNWTNEKIIRACYALSDEELDAEPHSVTKGNIRETLTHLVTAQRGYLALLTLPVEDRPTAPLAFVELQESARESGEGLLTLARGQGVSLDSRLQTRDRYHVEPWVVMVQVINHASEHREQISSMLSSLGISPPDMDGWSYGEATNAFVPMAK